MRHNTSASSKLRSADYYPFGMVMTSRTDMTAFAKYKYGYNGKENDNEIKGNGNQEDYGFRIYDPRICRFLSVDPLTKSYPELTPYQYASNTPIQAADLDGLEAYVATYSHYEKTGKTQLELTWNEKAEPLSGNAFHQVHNYYDKYNVHSAKTTGIGLFSDNPGYFRESTCGPKFTISGNADFVSGIIADEVGIVSKKVGFRGGLEKSIIGISFNYTTGSGLNVEYNHILDGKNPQLTFAVGAGVGFEFNQEYNIYNGMQDQKSVEYSGPGFTNVTYNSDGSKFEGIELEGVFAGGTGVHASFKIGYTQQQKSMTLYELQQSLKEKYITKQDNTAVSKNYIKK